MWEAAGVPFTELLDRLIDLALDRHRIRQATRFKR
jgi:D-alanine-D-alanine ligase